MGPRGRCCQSGETALRDFPEGGFSPALFWEGSAPNWCFPMMSCSFWAWPTLHPEDFPFKSDWKNLAHIVLLKKGQLWSGCGEVSRRTSPAITTLGKWAELGCGFQKGRPTPFPPHLFAPAKCPYNRKLEGKGCGDRLRKKEEVGGTEEGQFTAEQAVAEGSSVTFGCPCGGDAFSPLSGNTKGKLQLGNIQSLVLTALQKIKETLLCLGLCPEFAMLVCQKAEPLWQEKDR